MTTKSWQDTYRAPQRVQWLLLDRAPQTLTQIALTANFAILILALGLEIVALLKPGSIYNIILLPLFAPLLLTQGLLIFFAPARVAALLDRPYQNSFRTNDPLIFASALTGPYLGIKPRIAKISLLTIALLNGIILIPQIRNNPSNADTCPPAGGFCTSPATSLLPILAIIAIITTAHFTFFLGLHLEQQKASKEPQAQPIVPAPTPALPTPAPSAPQQSQIGPDPHPDLILHKPTPHGQTLYIITSTIGAILFFTGFISSNILHPSPNHPAYHSMQPLFYTGFLLAALSPLIPTIYRRLAKPYKTFRNQINQFVTDTYNYDLTPYDLHRLDHIPTYLPRLGTPKDPEYRSVTIQLPMDDYNRIQDTGDNHFVYLSILPNGQARLVRTGLTPTLVQPHP